MHHAATAIFDLACDELLQLIKYLKALDLLDDNDTKLLHLLMQEAAVCKKEKFVQCRMDSHLSRINWIQNQVNIFFYVLREEKVIQKTGSLPQTLPASI